MVAKNFPGSALALFALIASCLGLMALRTVLFSSSLAVSPPPIRPTAPAVLTVYYHDRRPYYFADGDQVKGLVAERITEALRIARIEFRWERLPPVHQLQNVRDAELLCAGAGWFATEERRAFALFSESIFQDGPFVAIASARSARIPSSLSIDELFGDDSLKILVKDGYSYSKDLDQRLARSQARCVLTPAENSSMLQMLTEGRAELMFVSPDEAIELVTSPSNQSPLFRMIKITDMPAEPTRHLMFSRAVPEEMVRRIDHAIHQLAVRMPEGAL